MKCDLYVDGTWCASASAERIDVVDPTTEELIGDVPAGSAEDVDLAVAAARRALEPWSQTEPSARAEFVSRLADELERRQDEITDLVVAEVGTPRRVARWAQVGLGIVDLREAVTAAEDFPFEETLRNSLIVREPVGAVGCITPWNYPLHQITAKIGAALVTGCTVVVKASEVAPFTARALAEAVDAVGIPPGVFNLVHGYGPIVGEAIAVHPDIDMVSFTGSNSVGKRVLELAAGTVKRVSVELGGKSAAVLLDDLRGDDFAKAVQHTVRACFMNGGQSCNAQTRMLVPRSRLADSEKFAAAAVAAYTPGDPTDGDTKLGPMVTAAQRERVLGYIRTGVKEGARLVAGSVDAPARTGFFVEPTVFSEVDPDATIAQEEIFGPVLSIIPYDTLEHAIAIANGTIFGIAGAVWSSDPERATSVGRKLRATQIEVNGGKFNGAAPFGGFKQSGHGREGGAFGLAEFTEVKSLQL
ncbi:MULTISPECIES: aldehyde dehydrogenase family protein [unclassified Rhodococcus (in: high G+C Gram-positive bacteria)]|uniref:aldehyde dehydrogenase family protein n=1 Tax=unclassified Rhodococcus (in: high G+C Gram-positive bacteria) TaxID=192944 RepID=UPI00163A856D|nr:MULTISPECIES: aldehyde dehydrogenase family protein [unclassified Rhodococcus (in: high G+C Gram-positive bacteria)]MBC2640665.1 aldehyde dehydrogenase family protein [Rhodococcus sp. 3A]MBC2894590.1 aldehyde dehydrogenase family protein [Rhodococcus sp. 4CII]